MSWTYIKRHATDDAFIMTAPPWQAVSPSQVPPAIRASGDKRAMATWCAAQTTDHVFYAAAEGVNPALRISQENPPREVVGFIGDYDSDRLVAMTDAEVIALIKACVAKNGIHPNYMSRTFSNKVRLIWEFEKPLPGEPESMCLAVIEEFMKVARVSAQLPGLDPCSKKPGQYYELGTGWTDFKEPPVPATTIQRCVFDVGSKQTIQADTAVEIPLDVISAEIDARFPGRVTTPLNIGDRVPLFWINDGINRIGAQVRTDGVSVYSHRAPYTFASWKTIFGAAFVKQYEDKVIATVLDRFAYDGNRYWIKTDDGVWWDHPKENLVPRLRKAGFPETKKKGEALSPIEETTLVIQDHRRVTGVAPFLYWKSDLVTYQGQRYLNNSTTKAMDPSGTGETNAARWPFLHSYLADFLEPDSDYPEDPLDYLLTWMLRMWKSAWEGHPLSGQMVILAGDANTGKTLFSKHVLGGIMGGSEDAAPFMMGGTQFNKKLLESGVWRIDDASPAKNENDHTKFTDNLKKLVANGDCVYQAKFRDQATVPWKGRVVLTCNMDAASQGILPNLGPTIQDKMMLFKVNPRPEGFFPANVEQVIAQELPYFLDWLLNTYTPPPAVVPADPRFGVKVFHHHEIVSTVREMSTEQNLADLIELWAKEEMIRSGENTWVGKPSHLHVALKSCESIARSVTYSLKTLSIDLKAMRQTGHWRIKSWSNAQRSNIYTIRLDPEPPSEG